MLAVVHLAECIFQLTWMSKWYMNTIKMMSRPHTHTYMLWSANCCRGNFHNCIWCNAKFGAAKITHFTIFNSRLHTIQDSCNRMILVLFATMTMVRIRERTTFVHGLRKKTRKTAICCLCFAIFFGYCSACTQRTPWGVFSDSCYGQNKNINVLSMLSAKREQKFKDLKIYYTFPICGHSFLPLFLPLII